MVALCALCASRQKLMQVMQVMQSIKIWVMVSNKIRFQHFFSERGIVELQREFLEFDQFTNPATINIVKPKPNLTIQVRDVFYYDEPGISSEITITKEFDKDFLIPSIATLADSYYEFVVEESQEKVVVNEEDREAFVKKYIKLTRGYRNRISEAKFLKEDIQSLILEQLDILEHSLEAFVKNPYPTIKKKIQFNWIRTDVEVFFYFLRKNKTIAHIEDADLGRIIDHMCECLKSSKSKVYTSISGSSDKLNGIKNETNTIKKSIKRFGTRFMEGYFRVNPD